MCFVHNMRAKKIKALGFGPDPVRARNNQIVYAGLHGYLEEGPYGDRPAYDDVIQGQAGIAGTFQVRDGEPAVVPSIMADKTAALMAVNGILAAVIKRARTGTGSYVEMGMFEALSGFNLVEHQYGEPSSRRMSSVAGIRACSHATGGRFRRATATCA